MPGLLDQETARIGPNPRNSILGALADALGLLTAPQQPTPIAPIRAGADGIPTMLPRQRATAKATANPIAELAGLVGLPPVSRTLDRMSYGLPLTEGQGQAMQMLPDTRDALLTAGPVVAKWPQAAAKATLGLMGAAAGAEPNALKAMIAWHGSPHKFDRFDASKIGTGEGAQAYGHGLYLAESPDVARSYQRDLSTKVTANGRQILANNKRVGSTGNTEVDDYLIANNGDLNAALRQAILDRRSIPVSNGNRSELDPVIASLKGLGGKVDTVMDGHIYKVDLPDSMVARMLDWDKPLSQQAPEVRNVFPGTLADGRELAEKARQFRKQANAAQDVDMAEAKRLFNAARMIEARRVSVIDDMTGRDLYSNVSSKLGMTHSDMSTVGLPGMINFNNPQTAQFFRDLGIPGIRYLDGGSRGAGAGTSNFVVFPGEENALRILERNGLLMP